MKNAKPLKLKFRIILSCYFNGACLHCSDSIVDCGLKLFLCELLHEHLHADFRTLVKVHSRIIVCIWSEEKINPFLLSLFPFPYVYFPSVEIFAPFDFQYVSRCSVLYCRFCFHNFCLFVCFVPFHEVALSQSRHFTICHTVYEILRKSMI